MRQLKAFCKGFCITGGLAFGLYIAAGGIVGLVCGWPFTSFTLPGAVGCGIGAGLVNGAFFAWNA